MANDARSELLTLLAKISFKLGQFKLSSGGASDYYIDCRTTTLHAEGGRLTGLAILHLLHQHKLKPAAVGGLTMGADPIVSNVATASAYNALKHRSAPLVHGFLVRKAEKTTVPAAASKASARPARQSSSSTTSAPPEPPPSPPLRPPAKPA